MQVIKQIKTNKTKQKKTTITELCISFSPDSLNRILKWFGLYIPPNIHERCHQLETVISPLAWIQML